jgi:hypothetical protein
VIVCDKVADESCAVFILQGTPAFGSCDYVSYASVDTMARILLVVTVID